MCIRDRSLLDGVLSEGLEQERLAGPGRPAHHEVLPAVDPFQVRSACWVGAGIEDASGDHAWNVLPVGNPAAARRVASAERSLPAASSAKRARRTSTGSQRWALAVATTSG